MNTLGRPKARTRPVVNIKYRDPATDRLVERTVTVYELHFAEDSDIGLDWLWSMRGVDARSGLFRDYRLSGIESFEVESCANHDRGLINNIRRLLPSECKIK